MKNCPCLYTCCEDNNGSNNYLCASKLFVYVTHSWSSVTVSVTLLTYFTFMLVQIPMTERNKLHKTFWSYGWKGSNLAWFCICCFILFRLSHGDFHSTNLWWEHKNRYNYELSNHLFADTVFKRIIKIPRKQKIICILYWVYSTSYQEK